MTYLYPDTRIPKAIKIDNTKCLLATAQSNMDYQTGLLGRQNHAITLRKSRAVSYEVKYSLMMQPSNFILRFYPREIKTYVHTKTSHI